MIEFSYEASHLVNTLLHYNPPFIPLIAPLPDKTINLAFAEPLSASLLEQLAVNGYKCRNILEATSDRVA